MEEVLGGIVLLVVFLSIFRVFEKGSFFRRFRVGFRVLSVCGRAVMDRVFFSIWEVVR